MSNIFPFKSTIKSKILKNLKYNILTKEWARMRNTNKKEEHLYIEIDFTSKYNLMTIGLCGFSGLYAFYVSFKNTMVRSETFGKNFSLINEKYEQIHKDALGEDKTINKYGYPDMGNNIYSDILPYSDWVKINNAQRCHENYVSHLPVLYSTVFINALSFPRFTFYSLLAYMCARIGFTRGYLSFRGYNKAIAPDEV